MSEFDSIKLLAAIDKIINDPDKKYDECMIEQFLKSISDELSKLDQDSWNARAVIILEKMQSFVDDEAFVMLNQARVYKTYLSVFRSKTIVDDTFSTLRAYLESLWSSLGSVVVNHELAAITAVLMVLNELLKSDPVYRWIISQKFQPSISVVSHGREFVIEEVVSLAEFYVETSENYHTKHKAETLLQILIRNAVDRNLDKEHQHSERLNQLVDKLIRSKSTSLLHVLFDFMKKETSPDINKALLERFNIDELLFERFVTNSGESQKSLYLICRVLGLISNNVHVETILNQLNRGGHFEAMIAFLAESKGEEERSLLQSSLIGPLASKCETKLSREEEELVQRSILETDHRSDKIVTTCLIHLGRTIDDKPTSLTDSLSTLQIRILLDYVEKFSDTYREFKNVMLCCCNLSKLLVTRQELGIDSPFLIISTVLKVLQTIDIHDENLKPVILGLVKLLTETHRRIKTSKEVINDVSWVNIIRDLAAHCTDEDVQEDLDMYLQEFQNDYRPKSNADNITNTVQDDLLHEELKADIRSSMNDILDYELFSENILDCY